MSRSVRQRSPIAYDEPAGRVSIVLGVGDAYRDPLSAGSGLLVEPIVAALGCVRSQPDRGGSGVREDPGGPALLSARLPPRNDADRNPSARGQLAHDGYLILRRSGI